MSWFAVTDGTYKLVQYGTGSEVPPQLFNLSADPREMVNMCVCVCVCACPVLFVEATW
jgi:hypothetical protein